MFKVFSEVTGYSEEILSEFPELEFEYRGGRSREEVLKIIPEYLGFIAGDQFVFNEEFFAAATNLKVLTRFGAGVDNVDIEAAKRHGVIVSNAPGANAITVAEHTIGLMIAVMKRIAKFDRVIKEGGWPRGDSGRAHDFAGKVHGQVGFGQIGARVASICHVGLGMEELVYDPFVTAETVKEKVSGTKVDLDTLLEKSDVVTLNLVCNDETRGMFNYKKLKKMKKDAILINTARGGVIAEPDLAKLLEEGWFYGVGLDVTQDEPLKPNNPLTKFDRVTLTGHSASNTLEFFERATRMIFTDQMLIFKGKEPKHPWRG